VEVRKICLRQDASPPVTRETLLRIITRRPIPPGQIALYKALYEHPAGMSKRQLATMIRWDDETSLAGVLGALGRRVNRTSGARKQGIRVLMERRRETRDVFYRMHGPTRAVLNAIRPLVEAMRLSIPDIRRRYDRGESSWLRAGK
jgi:hypothetical protein